MTDVSKGASRKLSPTWYQSFDSRIVAYMEDDDNGRYVLASDHETLESERDYLKDKIANLEKRND